MTSRHSPLTRSELREMARKALENAKDLIDEASLLAEHKRWARVVFLSGIAGEELGKALMCISATVELAKSTINWKKFWRRYLSHVDKTLNVTGFETIALSDEYPDEELKALKTTAGQYNLAKLISLYSDIMQDGTAFAPQNVITADLGRNALKIGKGRLALFQSAIAPIIESKFMEMSDDEIRGLIETFRTQLEKTKSPEENSGGHLVTN